MNICIISSTFLPECNGVSIHLKNTVAEFSRMGHKVLVLCPDYGLESAIFPDYGKYRGRIHDNVEVRPIPTKRLPQRPESPNYRNWLRWRLENYIGSFKPDIIDVEEPDRIYGLSLFGMLPYKSYGKCIGVDYAQEKSIPIAAFFHTNFPAFANHVIPSEVPTPYRKDGKKVYGMVYGPYDVTLCSSRESYDFLKNHGLGNVKCGAFLGIDDAILGTCEKSRLVEDDERVKILYAGRFEKEKDINLVLDVFREMQKLHPDTALYLAGKGEGLGLALEAGEQNPGIKCLGYLEHHELAKVYNSVDIYFTPYAVETFGLTILESMSRGLPVVAANRGGAGHLVENGVNGFACSSVKAYVEALSTLVRDKALRRELGEMGRKFAERYSARNCACNLLKEYEILINRRDKHEKI